MIPPNIDFSKIDEMNTTDVQKMLQMLQPKMNKYIMHAPTPKQSVFMNLDCREAFFGGAAGGGKSDALLMDALQNVDQKGYAAIIFRKSFSDLVKPGALIERSKEWLLRFPEVKWAEKEKKFEWRVKYGPHIDVTSVIQFGYLETDNDKYNYQGGEYQYAGFDELTHISKSNYLYMFSRMRRLKGSKIPIKVRSASNPPNTDDGIWVYNRFVNPKTKKQSLIFIPAGMDDNPHLDAEEYKAALENLDAVSRAQLKDGNWEVVRKGNTFKRNWFETVDAAPQFRRRVRFWDMASSIKKVDVKRQRDPDYTVGFLISEADGIFYIEDIIRVQKRPAETTQIQKDAAKSDGYSTTIYEEQEPGSSGDSAIVLKAMDAMLGYNYRGVRSTGNKVLRAQAASAAAEKGLIKIVRGCRNIEDFFNEAESFPGGLHDDMVDGLSGGFTALANMPKIYVPIAVSTGGGSYWNEDGGLDYFNVGHSGYFGGI